MAPRNRFGASWWGEAWVDALEQSAGLDSARLSRGRTYARNGSVGAITVAPGYAAARVQGSHGRTYDTDVAVRRLAESEWEQVATAVGQRAAHVAALLDGDLDPGLVADAASADVRLLPGPGDLRPDCSCPDWAEPCKHAAALCYLIADELDRDPFLLFLLRGMPRDDLMALVRRHRDGDGDRAPSDPATDGVDGAAAWTARPPERPLEPVPALVDQVPTPRRPGRPALVDSADEPDRLAAALDLVALDTLALDATRRAWAMLADGMPSGLGASSRVDLARRAATSDELDAVHRLARRAGVPAARLEGWARAWRTGGEVAVAVLADAPGSWSSDLDRLEAGREALVEAGHARPSISVSWNCLRTRGLVLVLGPDRRWYALEEAGPRRELRLAGPPAADIAELVDPPG